MPFKDHAPLFDAVRAAGAERDLRLCGSRALNVLGLEKGFASWGSDIGLNHTPWEAGLSRFVRTEKPFVGRDAAIAAEMNPTTRRVLAAIDAGMLDAAGGEPITMVKRYACYVSSAGLGPNCDRLLEMCYLARDIPDGSPLEVILLGEKYPIKFLEEPPIDPKGSRMRM